MDCCSGFFTQLVGGLELKFHTTKKVFSPKFVDRGTLLMLEAAETDAGDIILDLGCGYGAVGVYYAKLFSPENVVMSDVCPHAVFLAKKNALANGVGGVAVHQSDGFAGLGMAGFSRIFCNPPYHADFAVPKHFIEKGFNRLSIGGELHMVTRREKWYRRKLAAIFGGVRVISGDGYYVFQAQKRSAAYAGRGK